MGSLRMITITRRISDNLIVSVDETPNLPSVPATIPTHYGGSIEDYEVVEITTQQAAQIQANFPAKSTLVEGTVAARTLPQIGTDKSQIQDTGADAATITVTVSDNTHTGKIWWTVDMPEGQQVREEENLVAGAATLMLTTEQIGTHKITADVMAYGQVTIEIEGI